MESHPDFILTLVLPFGLIFNLPLILFILAKMDIVSSAALSAKRKYAVLLTFVAAAVITPTTDILSQLCLAVPMLALYEASGLVIRYLLKK